MVFPGQRKKERGEGSAPRPEPSYRLSAMFVLDQTLAAMGPLEAAS